MRILGIDYGDVRIGLSMCDPMGWTAQMLETIHWRFDITKPLERIRVIVEEYGCKTLVVGMPRNMDGTYGFRADKTQVFIKQLGEILQGVEILTWDERLTTVMAQRAMQDMGIKAKDQKSRVDQMAAAVILQSYLDSRKSSTEK
jgi:putative Holliday junction resolvase